MARIYMVRHGEAAAKWTEDLDPGLSDLGRKQAADMAQGLAALGPLAVITSPLKRCLETASSLEKLWQVSARVEPAVAEIPSPPDTTSVTDRGAWLANLRQGNWDRAEDWLKSWREGVRDCLLSLREDTVVSSHFVATNVAVGYASGDERVNCFSPDNCSITIIENTGGALRLIEKGVQASTVVR